MGKTRTYRWDRRRKRDAIRNADRAFKAFWGFELLLIFIIFFVMLIGLRFFTIYAVTTSTCQEFASSFGVSFGLGSAFDVFYWITWLSIGFWGAVTFAFSKIIWKSKSAIVHIILLIALVLALGGFNSMRLDKPAMPDGVLMTGPVTIDYSVVPPVFKPADNYGRRVLASAVQDGGVDYFASCVWLERGLIEAQDYVIISGQKPRPTSSWQERGDLFGNTVMLIGNLYSADNLAEVIQESQVLRPLTEGERADFIEKQSCLADLGLEYQRYTECDYVRIVD